MRHVVTLLRAHADLTKLEFEDGLLRGIIPARLGVESSLFGIDVDLRAESQSSFGAAAVSGAPDAVLTLSALDEAGPTAEEIEDMVGEVASPTAFYVTESSVTGEDAPSWVGTATPGTKLMVFVRQLSADAETAAAWLDSATAEIGRLVEPGHIRVHRVVDSSASSPSLDAILTVRFPTADDITAAEEAGLTALLDADDADTSSRLLAFEHRFSADPNHWGAPSPSPPSVA